MQRLIRIPKHHFSHSKVAIIGGGTGGLNTSAQLIADGHLQAQDIRVFDPKSHHAYQPGFTMVGGGIYDIQKTMKPIKDVLNPNISIINNAVTKVNPEANEIITENGDKYTYDQLVISSGLFLDFDQIKGARKYLEDPDQPVGCIYHYKYTQKMNKMAEEFEGGKLIFTEPQMPIKCGGAPQKIMYLTWDRLRKRGIKGEFHIHKTIPVMFPVPKYSEILSNLCDERGIKKHFKSKLIEVQDHKVVFENQDTKEITTEDFDLLHLVPPQGPPGFIRESGLGDVAGYVDIDPKTLQHKKYNNIWALGDCSNLPTSKTAAAIMAQTPVLVQNMIRVWQQKQQPNAAYTGYTSCPIFTSQSKLLLAEFKYENQLDESFPILQSSDNRIMFHLKKDFFPFAYWKWVVKGKWGGRDGYRFYKGA